MAFSYSIVLCYIWRSPSTLLSRTHKISVGSKEPFPVSLFCQTNEPHICYSLNVALTFLTVCVCPNGLGPHYDLRVACGSVGSLGTWVASRTVSTWGPMGPWSPRLITMEKGAWMDDGWSSTTNVLGHTINLFFEPREEHWWSSLDASLLASRQSSCFTGKRDNSAVLCLVACFCFFNFTVEIYW